MLYNTTKHGSRKSSHLHTIFIPDMEMKQGLQDPAQINQMVRCSENNKHRHEIVFDEVLGQFIIVDEKNHTHEIAEQVLQEDLPSQKDQDVVDESYSLFDVAVKKENLCVADGNKCLNYVMGDQWEEGTKNVLNSQNRPAISVNMFSSVVKKLSGYFKQNLPDLTAMPIGTNDDITADVISRVVKNILHRSNQKKLLTSVFDDEVITGRGIFNVSIKPEGMENSIEVTRDAFDAVYFDKHDEVDLSDCQYFVKTRYMSEYELQMEFPEKAKELKKFTSDPSQTMNNIRDNIKHNYEDGDAYNHPDEILTYLIGGSVPVYDKYTKQYLVLEIERKINYAEYTINFGSSVSEPVRLESATIANIKSMGYDVRKNSNFTIRRDIICGEVVIESEDQERKCFSCIPAYSNLRKGRWYSNLKDCLDLQDEANKRFSQTTDVINKMASYNYFYDGDTFSNQTEEDNFKKFSSIPGSAFKVSNIQNKPVKEQGVNLPQEILSLEQLSLQRINNQFGDIVNDPNNPQQMTSRAMVLKERYGMLVNETMFFNFNLAFEQLGRAIVEMVQQYYTPQQILRIVRDNPQAEPTELDKMEDMAILSMLSNTDLLKYDITIDTTKFSSTFREALFEQLNALKQSGFPIPVESIINYSSVPDKQKIMTLAQQEQERSDKQQLDTNNSEIAKSLIGQGYDPETMLPLELVSKMKMEQLAQQQMPQQQMPPQQ